jgi:hypothetical protein
MDVERELTRVLRTVDVPPAPDPVAAVRAGMRHRQRVRRLQAATAALAVVGIALGASTVLGDDPKRTRITPVPGASAAVPGPSQTAEDADRDGVVPAVAALPFRSRVGIVASQVTPEGVWALSRMPSPGDPSTGAVGSPGSYGKTFVAATEYGEVLLLDATRSRIVRAFPLPGLPPQRLLVTKAAVYCERQGDGGLPDSMLCRIDRRSLTWKVRVFPSTLDSGFAPPPPDRFMPTNWTISAPLGEAVFQTLQLQAGELVVSGSRATGRIDPLTLELALTGHSLQPRVAGICAEAPGSVVSFSTSPDGVPSPRCSYARLDQSLQIENALDTSVTAVLSTGQRVVVPPHETRAFPGKLSDLVQVAGYYTVDLGPSRAELLVEG